MTRTKFGCSAGGREGMLYTLCNGKGMKVSVMDYGATLVSVVVPDREGTETDVILGFDSLEGYQRAGGYFGATVGRNCNRIEGASFSIDGKEYQLERNDRGNNLHSGSKGLSLRFWEMQECTEDRLVLAIEDEDLKQGFPGNARITVTFTVTADNGLVIDYQAVSDQKTVFNFTNHSYFNLDGAGSGTAMEHTLSIKASGYTPLKDSCGIPTGEILPVTGTPFDFRMPKTIGKDIEADDAQLKFVGGYDHNFVLDKAGEGVETVAEAVASRSGIRMTVDTDCPGMQLYTANFGGCISGKDGKKYHGRDAFCLETQYYPNAVNELEFPSPITDAGKEYRSRTIYKFDIQEEKTVR